MFVERRRFEIPEPRRGALFVGEGDPDDLKPRRGDMFVEQIVNIHVKIILIHR